MSLGSGNIFYNLCGKRVVRRGAVLQFWVDVIKTSTLALASLKLILGSNRDENDDIVVQDFQLVKVLVEEGDGKFRYLAA